MACDSQTLINTAYANGYAKLSDRDLRMAVLASACAGGGSGGGGVVCQAGAPVAAPASGCGVSIDSNTGVVYYYFNGSWH